MNRLLTMDGLKEFISFPDYTARYLKRSELMKRKPTRVIAVKELKNVDLDTCVVLVPGGSNTGAVTKRETNG